VFLLPSELESFGLAALEAHACELPVIATRIGGIPEVVNDGESGFLSDIGDIDRMAANTLKLLKDDDLRRSMGARGREISVQRYSTQAIIPQYIAFYEQVLNKTAAAATP
jgi:L-malate glycosyltransferase